MNTRSIKDDLKTPKRGWKYAAEHQTLASLCDLLGRFLCLNAQAVYDWAQKHSGYKALLRASPKLLKASNTPDGEPILMVAVLNDLSLEEAERALHDAKQEGET